MNDVITILERALSDLPDKTPWQERLRNEVWNVPVWVTGTQTAVPEGKQLFNLKLQPGDGDALPTLRVYLDESEALEALGQEGCFESQFFLVTVIADSHRCNVGVVSGETEFFMTHEGVLVLRDMVRMGSDHIPVSEEEANELFSAIRLFAKQAHAYCAEQPDVQRLYLAMAVTSGLKPQLMGLLVAANADHHADALTELNQQVFRPGWRFLLLDPLATHDIVDALKSLPPYYDRQAGNGLWARIQRKFSPPIVPLIEVNLLPDEATEGAVA